MVHGEDRRPTLNHALPMNYAKMKKQSADQTGKVIAKPVVEIHLTTERFSDLAISLCFNLYISKSADPFA